MTELTNLQIDEISLVDEGANPGANVLLYKRKKTSEPDSVTKAEKPNFDELTATLQQLTEKLDEHTRRTEELQFKQLAEKYELLGLDSDKLAKMLHNASREKPDLYKTAVKVLDGALAAVQKSGTFSELGKSGNTPNSNGDIQKFAAQIQKRKPGLTWRQALDEAYLAHPELI